MSDLDPNDPIAEIELAMLARLKAASDQRAVPYRWRTLETYPADWAIYLEDKVIRGPAAWVVFGGFGAPDNDAARIRLPATFGVVVLADNARGETERRHGGPNPASEVGSYRLALDAIALLGRNDLGLDIDGFDIGPIRTVRNDQIEKLRQSSMLAIEFTTMITIEPIGLDDADIGDFETFHANWDVPPFDSPHAIDADPGAAGRQLPDDAHADATDHVTLETQP